MNILGVPDLIAKLKAWKSPYKVKVLFLIKTTYIKLFLANIIFKENQNTSNFSLA
jgi:hypothetical protein